jgi:HAD superfamily hydrolase (TIGR01509 family)
MARFLCGAAPGAKPYGNVVRAVIFDLDGTVIDTESFTIETWPVISRKKGYAMSDNLAQRLTGISEAASRAILHAEFGEGYPYTEIHEEAEARYRVVIGKNGIPVKKGFWELLAHIQKLELPYALATSTYREAVGWKLDKAGLSGVFPWIVCGDEVKEGKPAPDIFLKAARLINVAPEDCIGIEDSEAGLRALSRAGIRPVFIKDLVTPAGEVMASVWKECRDLGEVRALLTA